MTIPETTPGLFVVFEGGDGVGKSTQVYANTFENTETTQFQYLNNISLKDAKANLLQIADLPRG